MNLLSFSVILLLSLYGAKLTLQSEIVEFHVGVILDLDSLEGRMGLSYLSMALSDFYTLHKNYTTKLVLHVRDSKGNIMDAAASALNLLKDIRVDAIVGPQNSAQANFVMDVGNKAHVPIISFSATSPSLVPRTPYFVQTAQSDDTQVAAIAAIVKAFQWREVVIIYEDTDYGNGIMPYLADAFRDINVRVSHRSIIPLSATDDFLLKELYKMMTMQTRVFVVHMSHSIGTRLFLKAKEIEMMSEGYAWITTSGLMDLLYSTDSHVVEAMQGVLGVKPRIPKSVKQESFATRWKREFIQNNSSIKQAEISIFGLWAYDTMWALAMAAESVGFREPVAFDNATIMNSINPFTFGISRTGPRLLKAMLETRFEGLSGDFHIVKGRLQPSSFQILNVVGKGEREIGIWSTTIGVSREFNMNVTNSYSTSKENLGVIIWPGETTIVPKGWEIRSSGKKLRIGVPVNSLFTELVKVERDPQTNISKVSGYCIDIFNSVIEALPYSVQYEYVPFANPDGSSAGDYNDLLSQVVHQKFDAAVGDFLITANRSLYVDFTLPFSEGGISMIVPITYEDTNNKWTFLKPLKTDLWLTSIAFFIFTGFAVWVLEHRINTAFRGPPSQNIGMIFWFPLSTLVYAHRERIVSNLARVVVVVWIFVVLILSSSYTASLSARLTVKRLRPTITDVEELIKNGDYVGHEGGSFYSNFLMGLGFDESMLKSYKHANDFDEALSKGSKNGGISAFFVSVVRAKLFISNYCNNYIVIGPTHRANGIAFVFQKGSALVADISRTIVNITSGDKILEIEKKWFGNRPCSGPDNTITSNSMTLESFEGLFTITGVVTASCVVLFSVIYLYKNKDLLQRISNSSTTTWTRLCALCRHFDQRDLSSYPFRRKQSPQAQFPEINDAGVIYSSYFSDSSNLSRNSQSSESPSSLEERHSEVDETIHPGLENTVVCSEPAGITCAECNSV